MQECHFGDLDLGESGDGRWNLQWKTIPCPSRGKRCETEGSHRHYGKIKCTGGRSGVKSMSCGGMGSGNPTPDGFFTFQDNSGSLCKGLTCTMQYTMGGSDTVNVPGSLLGGPC